MPQPPSPSMDEFARFYRENGYAILRGVFSPAEADDIRAKLGRVYAVPKDSHGDLLTNPELLPLVFDERILAPVRALIGSRLIYFGDSAFRYGDDMDPSRGFHQDSKNDEHRDPTVSDYPLVRVGLYLQDYAAHSGGLKLRRGSHRHVFLGRKNLKRVLSSDPAVRLNPEAFRLGPGLNLDTRPGDLAVWSMRTWHSGHVVRLRCAPNFCLNPRLEKFVPRFLALPEASPRAVIFSAYAAPSEEFESYLQDRLTHPSNAVHWKNCARPDAAVCKKYESSGVELRLDGFPPSSPAK